MFKKLTSNAIKVSDIYYVCLKRKIYVISKIEYIISLLYTICSRTGGNSVRKASLGKKTNNIKNMYSEVEDQT